VETGDREMNKRYSKWYQDEKGVIHKQCTKCNRYFTLDSFGNHKQCKFGKNTWCNNCVKQYTSDNKKERKIKSAERYQMVLKNNEEFIRENRRKATKHYKDNKREKLKYAERYRKEDSNKSKIKKYLKDYAQENSEQLKRYSKKWRDDHSVELAKYQKEKKIKDPCYRIRSVISSQVCTALKKQGGSKEGVSFFRAIGYTKEDLKHHLDNLLCDSMTWENYGSYWVVDHIIPRSFFKNKSMQDSDFKDCWALNNLRPLTRKENNIRGNRVTITAKMVEDIYGKIRSSEETQQLQRRFCGNSEILCNAPSQCGNEPQQAICA
jgi:hypothetical protein